MVNNNKTRKVVKLKRTKKRTVVTEKEGWAPVHIQLVIGVVILLMAGLFLFNSLFSFGNARYTGFVVSENVSTGTETLIGIGLFVFGLFLLLGAMQLLQLMKRKKKRRK